MLDKEWIKYKYSILRYDKINLHLYLILSNSQAIVYVENKMFLCLWLCHVSKKDEGHHFFAINLSKLKIQINILCVKHLLKFKSHVTSLLEGNKATSIPECQYFQDKYIHQRRISASQFPHTHPK